MSDNRLAASGLYAVSFVYRLNTRDKTSSASFCLGYVPESSECCTANQGYVETLLFIALDLMFSLISVFVSLAQTQTTWLGKTSYFNPFSSQLTTPSFRPTCTLKVPFVTSSILGDSHKKVVLAAFWKCHLICSPCQYITTVCVNPSCQQVHLLHLGLKTCFITTEGKSPHEH